MNGNFCIYRLLVQGSTSGKLCTASGRARRDSVRLSRNCDRTNSNVAACNDDGAACREKQLLGAGDLTAQEFVRVVACWL